MPEKNYKRILVDYIKKNLKKGYTEDSLRWALTKQGYSRILIENSIHQANREFSHEVPSLKEKPKISYEILDENNFPLEIKKSFWKRIFGK